MYFLYVESGFTSEASTETEAIAEAEAALLKQLKLKAAGKSSYLEWLVEEEEDYD